MGISSLGHYYAKEYDYCLPAAALVTFDGLPNPHIYIYNTLDYNIIYYKIR